MTINVERRLRRMARDSGYDIKKKDGGFRLIHLATNTLVAGDRYQLTLQDVTRELQKLHVIGR